MKAEAREETIWVDLRACRLFIICSNTQSHTHDTQHSSIGDVLLFEDIWESPIGYSQSRENIKAFDVRLKRDDSHIERQAQSKRSVTEGQTDFMAWQQKWHSREVDIAQQTLCQKMSNVLFHDLLVGAQTSWLQLANTYQEEGYVYEHVYSLRKHCNIPKILWWCRLGKQ